MRRREFIALLGGGAAAWPVAARAQQPERMRRVGILVVSGLEPLGPFREALSDLGYVEGKNIQMEVRSAVGQDARLPELAGRNWFAVASMSSSRYRPRPPMRQRMPPATSPSSSWQAIRSRPG